jgi:hypothetical protein
MNPFVKLTAPTTSIASSVRTVKVDDSIGAISNNEQRTLDAAAVPDFDFTNAIQTCANKEGNEQENEETNCIVDCATPILDEACLAAELARLLANETNAANDGHSKLAEEDQLDVYVSLEELMNSITHPAMRPKQTGS